MGKQQARLMRFALKYPNQWHSFANDASRTVQSLVRYGLLTVNWETKQFRLPSPEEVNNWTLQVMGTLMLNEPL